MTNNCHERESETDKNNIIYFYYFENFLFHLLNLNQILNMKLFRLLLFLTP
jgi:hypothetical protein